MTRFFGSLLLAAGFAAPAAAQDASALVGHWTGVVSEDGSIPLYTLSVHFNLDQNGDPVGLVEYDAFPCAGVWSNARADKSAWTFDETITVQAANCAPNVIIELTPRDDGALDVTLRPVGFDGPPSTGTLERRS